MPIEAQVPLDGLAARLASYGAGLYDETPISSAVVIPVEFGEWMPDRMDYGTPGATEILNAMPIADGYRPVPNISTVSSNAMTARCRGAIAAQDAAGNVYIYAGDQTSLYRLAPDLSFTDISLAAYSTAVDGNWEFAQFKDRVIAVNYNDEVQGLQIGASTTFSNEINSSNTPRARHVSVVRDFVVLAGTNDESAGERPERVWWSGFGDSTDFTPDVETQCDFNDMPQGGWVQQVVGGKDYGLVVMERGIYRMTFTGGGTIFRFDAIELSRGTPIPNSVIAHGRRVFFISSEGVFASDGLSSQPIGHEKVDRWFWDQFDETYVSRVSAAIDPVHKLVVWLFPGTGSTAGSPNRILIYNWALNRFSYAEITMDFIFLAASQGYTLDTLDNVSTDIDALAFSLDSRAWTGGKIALGGFDASFQYVAFTGANLAATLETREIEPKTHGFSDVTAVRPLVMTDGSSATITAAVAARDRLQDAASFGTAGSLDTFGECPVTESGRLVRARVSIAASGTWTHAVGAQLVVS